MELLQCLLPSLSLLRLDGYEMAMGDHHLTLNLTSTQTKAACPICDQSSHRIHSHYTRTLADLPCVAFSLTLIVQVCKFFCSNSDCRRRIFTERLPEVAAPWARKTVRFVQRLQFIGLALGGEAGARLGDHLGYASCGSTLLNHLNKLKLPDFQTPKVLGVDDFAFRKGHNYGTILVDLETHQPIALLADRKAETLIAWLQAHPGIDVLSRDRSKAYKRAMTEGAPDAIQVADRFHLVKNLSETIVMITPKPAPDPDVELPQRAQAIQQHRIEQQRTIKTLSEQRWPQAAIAQKVGVSMRTVQRFLASPDFLPKKPQQALMGQSILAPYKQQLLDWWNAEIRETTVLMALLKPRGYEGSLRALQRYIARLRSAQGLPPINFRVTPSLPKVVDPQTPPLTPRRAAYLAVLKPENREPEDTALLEELRHQHPGIGRLLELADEFLRMLREQTADTFDMWMMEALTCSIKPFQSFAKGLLDDYAAVKASLTTTVSNGPVEGLNNKLKMLKRQMYGRAGLDLLTKRFILAG